MAWHRIYYAIYYVRLFLFKYQTWLATLLIGAMCVLAEYFSRHWENAAAKVFADKDLFDALRTLLITVGAALLGATAIAFSFIMFAMQVNVERMPHGLFRKFTSDVRLMLAFGFMFALAIAVPSLALVPDTSWASFAISYALQGIILVFLLLIYSYRRALTLINPIRQLRFVADDAMRGLSAWGRRAQRAAPLLISEGSTKDNSLKSKQDIGRVTYFSLNKSWSEGAFRSLRHAVSLSRRYAELGDYEISSAALNAILVINGAYIVTKGKTFFSDNALFVNPFSSDGFINETLEALRQNAQIAVSRADEQQIEQTLRCLANLVQIYAAIDYSDDTVSAHHAQLAAAYLADATQSVVPHGMTDVTMEGIRLMGAATLALLAATKKPLETVTLAKRVGMLGLAGAINEKFRPLTLEAVERLARLTMVILKTKSNDVSFSLREIDDNITMIARMFLDVPDVGMSTHSTFLAPYFSVTSLNNFQSWLTDHTNVILQAPADSADAKAALDNIEEWSEEIYKNKKELLLLAIAKKSHFGFDLVHWISQTTKLLIALTAAPACEDRVRAELLDHALWLISVLSWFPDTAEATAYGENFSVSEQLFEVGWEGLRRGTPENNGEFVEKILGLLLAWGLRDSTYNSGRGVLEKAIYGCAALALAADMTALLESKLLQELAKRPAKQKEQVDRIARNIRRHAKSLRSHQYTLRSIDRALEQADRALIVPLLITLADILSPETAGEKITIDLF